MPGRLVVIGSVLGLAALDGALLPFIGAAALGGATYGIVRGSLNRLPRSVAATQRVLLDAGVSEVQTTADEKTALAARRKAESSLESIEKTLEEQLCGNSAAAACCGLAAFAYPPLAAAFALGATHKTWRPLAVRLWNKLEGKRQPPLEDTPAFKSAMASMLMQTK